MKRIPLQIHCVFTPGGEELGQLVLQSFAMYLRRILAEDNMPGES